MRFSTALRLLHKEVGLGREVGVPMRLAKMAFEQLTETMNPGWGTRNSRVTVVRAQSR
jgi:hypothetical protein